MTRAPGYPSHLKARERKEGGRTERARRAPHNRREIAPLLNRHGITVPGVGLIRPPPAFAWHSIPSGRESVETGDDVGGEGYLRSGGWPCTTRMRSSARVRG